MSPLYTLGTTLYAAYKKFTLHVRAHRSKVRGWEKIYHERENPRKAGVSVCVSDTFDFKTKTEIRDKDEC